MGEIPKASLPADSLFPSPQAKAFSGGLFFSRTFITLIHKD